MPYMLSVAIKYKCHYDEHRYAECQGAQKPSGKMYLFQFVLG
jgi:hypothetical protein